MAKSFTTTRMIAREARLSTATVSLVLNNRADEVGIKAATQQRVRDIAQRLNYVPNRLAVGLKGGATMTIGLMWSLNGPHDSQGMVHGISLAAMKHGYTTNVCNHLSDPKVVLRQLAELRQRRVDALVFQETDLLASDDEIRRQLEHFPAVTILGVSVPGKDLPFDWIQNDIACAYEEAALHFISGGRKRLAIMATASGRGLKVETFMRASRQRGVEPALIAVPFEGIGPVGDHYRHTLQEMMKASGGKGSNWFPFDAVMCTQDEGAALLMNVLREQGLRVPEDVAVIGCNGSEWGQLMQPPLASVDRRNPDVVEAVTRMVFDRLANPQLPPQRRRIPMRLIWRQSAGGGSACETK